MNTEEKIINRSSVLLSSASNFINEHVQKNIDFHKSLYSNGVNKSLIPGYVKGSVFTYESHIYFSILCELARICATKTEKELNILEIGTGTGYFSVVLSILSSFLESQEFSKEVKVNITSIDVNEDRIKKAKENLQQINLGGRVNFELIDSTSFFEKNKKLFNFILIDGSHDYHVFKEDLKASLQSVSSFFYIACDDAYETPDGFLGIYDAIVENKELELENCLFLNPSFLPDHNYEEDFFESERLDKKWKENNYRCWSTQASTDATSFGYTNISNFY